MTTWFIVGCYVGILIGLACGVVLAWSSGYEAGRRARERRHGVRSDRLWVDGRSGTVRELQVGNVVGGRGERS